MTSYVTIPNTDVDAESPIDVDLMTALRDNPTAITEGSAGAPKIQKDALDADVVDSTKVDFANCAGMFGTNLTDYETPISFTGTGYSTEDVIYIYIPPDASIIHYRMKVATSTGSYNSGGRFTCASANGDTFQTLATAETWSGDLELGISSESGWTGINIQVYNGGSAHTGYVYEWSYYIA